MGRHDLNVLDVPISRGAIKAALGRLTILTAGSVSTRAAAENVWVDMAEKVYPIRGGLGAASEDNSLNGSF
jgi:3-hydroxyisobutyrate dehydrogenase-like beta-hydroxyacid dehydrogenase